MGFGQLWEVGVTEIFLDGSFVEGKDYPGVPRRYRRILQYEALDIATGRLQRELNELDPHKVWTWNPGSRRFYKNQPKQQLPMWHRYRLELYPHYVDMALKSQGSRIRDEFGNDLPFPASFRKLRRAHKPKGSSRC